MDTHVVKCPACSVGILNISSDQIDIPHFGEVVISTLHCSSCGYRTSDIIPVQSKIPKRFTVVIDRPEILDLRVVRSGTSTVSIPEIGATIEPGLFSEGYVTNIEGILRRFLEIVLQIIRDMERYPEGADLEVRKARAESVREILSAYMEGHIPKDVPLTLMIEDPAGNSAIISDDEGIVGEENLSEEEIRDLLDSRSRRDLITNL